MSPVFEMILVAFNLAAFDFWVRRLTRVARLRRDQLRLETQLRLDIFLIETALLHADDDAALALDLILGEME